MRLDRIDLIAYGKFSGTSLDFSQGKDGLHVVFGENEAGKSTALAAIVDFLYGIPSRTDRNFVHSYSDLRIGATVRSDLGEVKQLLRRKRNRATLRDATDQFDEDESWLDSQLHGIGRESFQRQFGLGYDDLVAGGSEMVAGRGDLAELLFSAGAGLQRLRSTRRNLRSEADALWLRNGRLPIINRHLSDLKDLQREISQSSLSAREHHGLHGQYETLVENAVAQESQLGARRRELHHTERLQQAAKLAHQRSNLLNELETLRDVPLLPDDFAQLYWLAMREHDSLQAQLQSSRENIERLTIGVQEAGAAEPILEHATTIQSLYERVATHEKALRDCVELNKRSVTMQHDFSRRMAALGEGDQLEKIPRLRPSNLHRAEVQRLAGQRLALQQELIRSQREYQSFQQELEELQSIGHTESEPWDPRRLRIVLKQHGTPGVLSGKLANANAELQVAHRSLAAAVHRLPDWTGSAEQLVSLRLPAEVELEVIRREGEAIGQRERLLKQQLITLTKETTTVDAEIRRLQESRGVPTLEQLVAARQQRDGLWQTHHSSIELPFDNETFLRDISSAVAHADEIADRMRMYSQDVASLADRLVDRRSKEDELGDLQSQLGLIQHDLDKLDLRQSALWQEVSGIQIPSWAAGLDLLNKFNVAIERAEKVFAATAIRDQAAAEVSAAIEQIRDCLREAGVIGFAFDALDQWVAFAVEEEEALRRRRTLWNERRERISRLSQALRPALEAVESATRDWQRWETDWQRIAEMLGVSANMAPDDLRQRLDDIGELLEAYSEYQQNTRRITGINADHHAFELEIGRLARSLRIELPDDDRFEFVRQLTKQLADAQAADRRRIEFKDQLVAETQREQPLLAAFKAVQATIARYCKSAECDDPAEIPEIASRSRLHNERTGELHRLESALTELAGGVELNDFLSAATAVDANELESRRQELFQQVQQLETSLILSRESVAVFRERLSNLDQTSAAAAATEKADGIRTQLVTDVRRYGRLKLAEAILGAAMEEYRQSNQGPVLELASRFVAKLSCGSLSGLRSDVDEQGNPVLVGVRAEERMLGVEGMSEGLADQVYLALRLASLHQHLEQHAKLPLVVDDVLIKFDAPRSQAALELLAELSDRTQVIFFTHHQNLVDLAKTSVDASRLFVQSL